MIWFALILVALGIISLSYAWFIFFHIEGTVKVNTFCPALVFWKWYINFRELFLVLKFQFIQITEKMIGKRFEFMGWLNLYFNQLRDSISFLKIWAIFFSLQTVPTSFIKRDFGFVFHFNDEVTRPGRAFIIKVIVNERHNNVRSVAAKN